VRVTHRRPGERAFRLSPRRGNGHKEAQKAQEEELLFVPSVPFCGEGTE
jgi:hypothetical protein